MLDPLILQIISYGFGLLFLMAASHKISNRLQFRGIVAAYQILPKSLIAVAASVLPWFEVVLGLAWFALALQGWLVFIVPYATAMLLTGYATAIGINLLRGRTYIDCGCGFSSATRNNSNNDDNQKLSSGLIVRNLMLIVAALLTTLPSNERLLGVVDLFSTIAALVAFILLYSASNQLMLNRNAIGNWRNVS